MAEGSSPKDNCPATNCQPHEVNDILFNCFTSDEYMCTNCKIAHQNTQAAKGHEIKATKSADQRENVDNSKCKSHQTEDTVMFCKESSSPVCRASIGDRSHQQNKLTKTESIAYELHPELSKTGDETIMSSVTKLTTDIKIMSMFTMKNINLVTAINETQAWVQGYDDPGINLISFDGEVIKTVKKDFRLFDMAVTTKGELVVTVYWNNKVKKMTKKGKFTDVYVAPEGHVTKGITVTDDNQITVVLFDKDKKVAKIVQLYPHGELRNIVQYDSTDGKTPLFKYADMVCSNRNGDLIVTGGNGVVVVSKTGQARFTYEGQQSLKGLLFPMYTVTDKCGHILISDYDNNAIHLLDIDGKFLQLIFTDKYQLLRPRGMSIDTSGRLWVCSFHSSNITILKYF